MFRAPLDPQGIAIHLAIEAAQWSTVPSGRHIMAHRLNALNSTRLIAAGRFLLAEFLFFYATSDPDNPGFRHEWDDFLTMAYLAAAVVMVLIVWKSWWLDFILFPVIFSIDIVAFLMLPSLLKPLETSYSVAAVAMVSFILLCSSVRWNWRTTVIFAIALNASCLLISIVSGARLFDGIPWLPEIAMSEVLRRLMLLVIVSLFSVWAGLRLSDPKLAKFAPDQSATAISLLGELLDYALLASSAKGGAISWAGNDAPYSTIVRCGAGGAESSQDTPDFGLKSDGRKIRPVLYDRVRHRIIALTDQGEFVSQRDAVRADRFLDSLETETGISVPLQGVTGQGRLVMSGVPLMSWDHLRLANAIAHEAAHAIDRQAFDLAAREAAMARLRHAVARDLHDSVAQSLAGARFWMQSLKAKPGVTMNLVEEIDKIQAALESESTHIRNLIVQLRKDEREPGERSLTDDLDELLSTLSLHWRIEARLAKSNALLPVAYHFSFEVQQIIREAVANAVKHGDAGKVDVSLERDPIGIRLIVEDNGSGFPDQVEITIPVSISERVAALGGSLDVSSIPGRFRIEITLPTGAMH